jgi:hypothetical protein
LKDTINTHGPITKNFIPSAAKRVAGRIYGEISKNGSTEEIL